MSLQYQITPSNNRPEIVLDDLCKHAVRGRQSTNLDGRSSVLTLRDNMEELPELIQGRSQHHFIEGIGKNLEHRHPNNLADDLMINHNNMPCNRRLYDNHIVIILYQSGEHNVGTVVEVAPVIGLDNLMDIIQESDHNISSNNIPLWNDCPVHYLGS